MPNRSDNPVSLAFLGCGFATHLHSKTLRRFKHVQRYYASRDAEKARRAAEKYRGAGSFLSYEAAIEAPEIDVVLVATPPSRHLDLTLRALQAGKHVIVEKPPFLSVADFDRVRRESERVGRQVFVAENYFYKPLAVKLRELLLTNMIGKVRFVHVNALKRQRVNDWRADPELAGGGALMEGGIHWVNFVANLGLTVERVSGFFPDQQAGRERSALLAFRFREGAAGALYYSWETPSLFRGLRLSKIYGTHGSITFESNGLFVAVRGRQVWLLFPGLRDIAGYRAMFADFFASLQEERPARFTLDLARQDLALIEQAYRTAPGPAAAQLEYNR